MKFISPDRAIKKKRQKCSIYFLLFCGHSRHQQLQYFSACCGRGRVCQTVLVCFRLFGAVLCFLVRSVSAVSKLGLVQQYKQIFWTTAQPKRGRRDRPTKMEKGYRPTKKGEGRPITKRRGRGRRVRSQPTRKEEKEKKTRETKRKKETKSEKKRQRGKKVKEKKQRDKEEKLRIVITLTNSLCARAAARLRTSMLQVPGRRHSVYHANKESMTRQLFLSHAQTHG